MGHSATARTRLSRQSWIDAAMVMGARIGFDHLAVEPLAAELGTTKGSFYWHFADRAALLDAVLAQWELDATSRIIDSVEAAPPDERLARLMELVFGHPAEDVVEWRILAATDHPQVGPIVGRVHDARIAYLRRLLSAQGLPPKRAAARARIVYASYLGHLQLVSTGTVAAPSRAALTAFVDEVTTLFTAP